jgi:hypothetical protein
MGFHALRVGAKILRDRFKWVPEAPVVAILAASGVSPRLQFDFNADAHLDPD